MNSLYLCPALAALMMALMDLPPHPLDVPPRPACRPIRPLGWSEHCAGMPTAVEIAVYPEGALQVVAAQLRRQHRDGELQHRPRPPKVHAMCQAAVPAAVDFAAALDAVFARERS